MNASRSTKKYCNHACRQKQYETKLRIAPIEGSHPPVCICKRCKTQRKRDKLAASRILKLCKALKRYLIRRCGGESHLTADDLLVISLAYVERSMRMRAVRQISDLSRYAVPIDRKPFVLDYIGTLLCDIDTDLETDNIVIEIDAKRQPLTQPYADEVAVAA